MCHAASKRLIATCVVMAMCGMSVHSSCRGSPLRSVGAVEPSPAAGRADEPGDVLFRDAFDAPPYRVVGTTRVYEDRSAFLDAIELDALHNPFDDLAPGTSGELRYAGQGFEYAITTQFRARGLLYNGPGFVSTDSGLDQIAVVSLLSGRSITAMGGDFWPTDFLLRPDLGDVEIDVADAVEVIPAGASNAFRGFITRDPLVALFVEAPDPVDPDGMPHDRWPALDNLVVGTAR